MYVVLRVPLGICSGGKIKYLHVLVYTLVSFTNSRSGLEPESRNALRLLDCVTPAQEVVQDVCTHPIQGEVLSHSPSVCYF